ncbi:MAG: hypothetical protein ACPG5P_01865 [Saprospiraceae bacterium]
MAKSTKNLLKEFEEKVAQVAASTANGLPLDESEEQQQKRINMLLGNYPKFCRYYFPDYCPSPLAGFQNRAARAILNTPNRVSLIQWARESAKSTHFNFLFPMFLLLNKDMSGMIAGAANQDLAIRLLFDIKANIEANHRIINDFGELKSYGNWAEDRFATKDGIAFLAFGRQQTPRGTRFGSRRPDYGTVDDFNDKKSLKNDRISHEDYEWVKEDFMGALSIKKWRCIIPQNKFHKNTVTAKFEEDREIDTYLSRVNLLDDKGIPTWQERFTKEECEAKIKSLGHFSSQREYFNNPVQEGKIFKRENLRWGKRLPFKQYDALVAYCDPSYKNSDKSDYKATILIGKKDQDYHILRAYVDKVSVTDMFLWHYALDEWVGDRAAIRHWMEANFIQDLHMKLLDPLSEKQGYRLRLSKDKRKKPDKFQRISSLEPLFDSGTIIFNQAEKSAPGMMRLIDQLTGFEKGGNLNDDGPDALEGGIHIIEGMTKKSHAPTIISKGRANRFSY